MNSDFKKCLYCSESIEVHLIKCNYCGEILENINEIQKQVEKKSESSVNKGTGPNSKSDYAGPKGNFSEEIRPSFNYKKFIGISSVIVFIAIISVIVFKYFRTPDFSNPQEVIEKTEELWRKNDVKTYYNYISDKSKNTYKSYDEFVKIRVIPDSTFNKLKLVSLSVEEVTVPDNYENYKRFKIVAIDRNGEKIDTNVYYRTLVIENGDWKLTWSKELYKEANGLYQQGEFKKAVDIYYSSLEIDPFSITARTQLVWCYIRDVERPSYWQDTCSYHLNFLLSLDNTDSGIYNALGAFYSEAGSNTQAVQYFVMGAALSNDSMAIANFYSNAAQNAKMYDLSKSEAFLEQSLNYNSKSRFTWQTLGDLLYHNQDYVSAKKKYSKAIELSAFDSNSDNYTLIGLYGYYALTCKKLGEDEEAEAYILKCIRVYPDKTHPIFKELNL